jgi:hypothetical protein
MKRLGALIACAILGACTTQAQQQQAALEAVNACYEQAWSTPAGMRAESYIVMGEDDPVKLQKLGDQRFVDEAMRNDLIEVDQARLACRKMERDRSAALHPALGQVTASTFAAHDSVLLALINGQVSVGKANEAYLEVGRLYEKAWVETGMAVDQQRAAAYAAQEQQRQAGLNMLQQWALQQQPRRSTTTNCTTFGDTLNCRSF